MFGFITKPIRGIGRLARGKFKEGLGDIGAGAKGLAPILAMTGVGALPAMALGAAGGMFQGIGEGKGIGGAAKGAAGGAAMAGVGALGAKFAKAGQAVGNPFAASTAAAGAKTAVPAQVASLATEGGRGALSKIGSAGAGVGRWATKRPDLALQAVGTAADAYGSHQQGKAYDRQADIAEENMRRNWDRQDTMDTRKRAMDPILAEIIQRLMSNTAGMN